MSANLLHESMSVTFARCLEISRAKNADYADDADPFANFRRSELVGVPVARGILVRLTDKVARVSNLLDHAPAVADEKIADTIEDAINYLAILKAWLEQSAPQAGPTIREIEDLTKRRAGVPVAAGPARGGVR